MSHIVLRGKMPTTNQVGTIDVWWVQHDGGLLLLLPMLLLKHRIWAGCSLRVFAVVAQESKSKELQESLDKMLYDLRIHAHAEVVVVPVVQTAYKEEAARLVQELAQQSCRSFAKRLPAALELNAIMRKRSSQAKLVVTNMPHSDPNTVPKNYLEFADRLTSGVPQQGPCILTCGTGSQLISSYS